MSEQNPITGQYGQAPSELSPAAGSGSKCEWIDVGGFAEISNYRCSKCGAEISEYDGRMTPEHEKVFEGECPNIEGAERGAQPQRSAPPTG